MLYGAEVAVCSEINAKQINTVCVQNVNSFSFKTCGCTQPVGFKRLKC